MSKKQLKYRKGIIKKEKMEYRNSLMAELKF